MYKVVRITEETGVSKLRSVYCLLFVWFTEEGKMNLAFFWFDSDSAATIGAFGTYTEVYFTHRETDKTDRQTEHSVDTARAIICLASEGRIVLGRRSGISTVVSLQSSA